METYNQLGERAKQILKILRSQARRAFILEITGTPKAGKTTSISTLESFFKSCGYKVHVLKERAAECPLPMKGHFFFNAWTTCTMIAEVLAIVDTKVDLLILDRGFFDSLVWLQLQSQRGQVTTQEMDAFAKFVLLERWRSLVNLTVIMRVEPREAIRRENVNRIIPRYGSMMNEPSLSEFNDALRSMQEQYRNLFAFESIDSKEGDGIVATNARLADKLLSQIESWADPYIAVIPRCFVIEKLGANKIIRSSELADLWTELESLIVLKKRSVAETDPEIVQLVACGVHTDTSKVFLFQRSENDEKSRQYGHHTIWKGCHIAVSEKPDLARIQECLLQRIRSDLYLTLELKVKFVGIAWDNKTDKKHLGLVFTISIDNPAVATSMKQKEFRTSGRGHEMTGDFWSPGQLLANATLRLEPWSKAILNAGWVEA